MEIPASETVVRPTADFELIDKADIIAHEHIAWAKSIGLRPGDFRDVFHEHYIAFGPSPGWDDVRFALGSMWLSLNRS